MNDSYTKVLIASPIVNLAKTPNSLVDKNLTW